MMRRSNVDHEKKAFHASIACKNAIGDFPSKKDGVEFSAYVAAVKIAGEVMYNEGIDFYNFSHNYDKMEIMGDNMVKAMSKVYRENKYNPPKGLVAQAYLTMVSVMVDRKYHKSKDEYDDGRDGRDGRTSPEYERERVEKVIFHHTSPREEVIKSEGFDWQNIGKGGKIVSKELKYADVARSDDAKSKDSKDSKDSKSATAKEEPKTVEPKAVEESKDSNVSLNMKLKQFFMNNPDRHVLWKMLVKKRCIKGNGDFIKKVFLTESEMDNISLTGDVMMLADLGIIDFDWSDDECEEECKSEDLE